MIGNFRQYANLAQESYIDSNFRNDVGSYKYHEDISGPYTAVFSNPTETVVSHRGTKINDLNDVYNDARIMAGYPVGQQRLDRAKTVTEKASKLGKPVKHTGHSLGGAVARKVSRDRGESNTTFNRFTGMTPNSENWNATKKCKANPNQHPCNNTTDVYNKSDYLATTRVNSDYGRKVPIQGSSFLSGPIQAHGMKQFTGKGKKKSHPQQKLMDLALKYA